jgi:predicted ATPase/DNA-binding winged helix-turn-helix (wHTH) protein
MAPDDHNGSSIGPLAAAFRATASHDAETAFTFDNYRLLPKRRLLFNGERPVELKSRAFEVMLAVVEAGGALVTREELNQRLWPNTFVEPHNLDTQISTLRKALGTDRRLIHTEPGRGWRVAATVRLVARAPAPTPVPARDPATNVPLAVAPLVGRERELSELPALVARHRLVTLTGPGGIGKTRLGFAAARLALERFADSAWVVELAALIDAELVPGAIARVLGIAPGSNCTLVDQLVTALQWKHLLLVIDNCEHVIGAVAQLAETLLRGTRNLHILATSREPLEAEGEHVFRVSPLTVPPLHVGDVDQALEHSAVQLFVDRTRAADRAFVLDAETMPGVTKICRHLDGIPLAIELAAGCVASIGVDTLAGRLGDRFRLLAGGRRCALPRHQTLSATLEWSYGLLTQAEQAVLRRVALFAGSFTLDGAAAVAEGNDITAGPAEGHIARLVRKSLIALDTRGAATRYRLLDTTRVYARQKLAESGEFSATARRHAGYYRRLLERAERYWYTTPAAELAAVHAPEIDDIRAAIDWAFEADGDSEIGIALVATAIPLWTVLSVLAEFRDLVHIALSRLDPGDSRYSRYEMVLQAALGTSSLWAYRAVAETHSAATRALLLAEQLGDTEYQMRALYILWIHQLSAGEYESSLALANRLRQLADDGGDMPARVTGARVQGTSLFYLAEYDRAQTACEHVLGPAYAHMGRSFVFRFGIDQRAGIQVCMVRLLWVQGFPDQAARLAQASLDEMRALNHANSLCLSLSFGACCVAALAEDLAGVETFAPELAYLADKHALGMWQPHSLAFKGWIAVRRGDTEDGIRDLTAALGAPQQASVELHQIVFAGTLAQALAAVGRHEDGLKVINRAIAESTRCKGYWCLPELLRIRAAVTLDKGRPAAIAMAEKDLVAAMELARRQQAGSWQLRVATALAKLWHDDGQTDRARALLLPIFDGFTEGFETRDFKAAKNLADMLS